jgi:hypothetical protein
MPTIYTVTDALFTNADGTPYQRPFKTLDDAIARYAGCEMEITQLEISDERYERLFGPKPVTAATAKRLAKVRAAKYLTNAQLAADLKKMGVKGLSGKNRYQLLVIAFKAGHGLLAALYCANPGPEHIWATHCAQRENAPEMLAGNPRWSKPYTAEDVRDDYAQKMATRTAAAYAAVGFRAAGVTGPLEEVD